MQPLIDFYKAKRRSLVYVASKRVGPDWAEDAVHDAFVNAITYYESYNPGISDLDHWFGPIFNNVCKAINKINRGGNTVEIQESDWSIDCSQEDNYFLVEILDKIKDYPLHQRQVLYCAFALQYPNYQIVKVTGLNLLHVKQIKLRFRLEMRERYGEDSSA